MVEYLLSLLTRSQTHGPDDYRYEMKNWLRLALSRGVVQRALAIACIVGPILVLINQGDVLWRGDAEKISWLKALLTFLVPYAVSTVSSVGALRQSRDIRNP